MHRNLNEYEFKDVFLHAHKTANARRTYKKIYNFIVNDEICVSQAHKCRMIHHQTSQCMCNKIAIYERKR